MAWYWWAVGAAVVALWTAGSFGWWPFANCRRCGGKGRWRNPNPPNWRQVLTTREVSELEPLRDKWIWCSVCRGTGRRMSWR